jgi:hypothetical protein
MAFYPPAKLLRLFWQELTAKRFAVARLFRDEHFSQARNTQTGTERQWRTSSLTLPVAQQ